MNRRPTRAALWRSWLRALKPSPPPATPLWRAACRSPDLVAPARVSCSTLGPVGWKTYLPLPPDGGRWPAICGRRFASPTVRGRKGNRNGTRGQCAWHRTVQCTRAPHLSPTHAHISSRQQGVQRAAAGQYRPTSRDRVALHGAAEP
jgi:hypothetical protein